MKKFAAVLGIVAVLTIGGVAPASAVGAVAAGNEFIPSPNKFREFMLNVTSKVLGAATPESWKREQLANQHRYNHSWEALNKQYGFDRSNPNYGTYPDSYDDYVIGKIEEQEKKGGTGGKPFRAPATAMTKFLGNAFSFVSGWGIGISIGNVIVDSGGGLFGFDANGVVCNWTTENGLAGNAVETVLGRDCSMFGFSEEMLLDSDVFKKFCAEQPGGVRNTFCVTPSSIVYTTNVNGTVSEWFCVNVQNMGQMDLPDNTEVRMVYTRADGSTQIRVAFPPSPNPFGECANSGNAGVISHNEQPSNVVDFHIDVKLVYQNDWTPVEGESTGESPERVLDCEVHLTDGTIVRTTSGSYRHSDGSFSPPSCPSVGDDEVPDKVTIKERKKDDPPGTGETVYDQPTTNDYKDWKTRFPECSTGACKLDLIKKPLASCFDLEYECAEWWSDPAKTTNYQCKYGSHNVEIEECAVYSGLFKPGRADVGAPYSDPMTGDWTGGTNAPAHDKQAMAQKLQNPAQARACTGLTSGGFDPVGFILRPIQCALEWAFVPRPLVVEAHLAGGEHAWEGKPPAVIAGAVANAAPSASVDGCARTVSIFSGEFQTSIKPLDACPGSWSAPLAAISKIATSAAMAVLVFVVVRRQISGMVGYGAGQ